MTKKTRLPTIAIIGPAGCGKDECARTLASMTPLVYEYSTSDVIAHDIAVREGRNIDDVKAEKAANRAHWLAVGEKLREGDPAALVKNVLQRNHIVVGIRRFEEFRAGRHLFDLVVYVERPGCEDSTFQLVPEDADIVLLNNRCKQRLHEKLGALARFARLTV